MSSPTPSTRTKPKATTSTTTTKPKSKTKTKSKTTRTKTKTTTRTKAASPISTETFSTSASSSIRTNQTSKTNKRGSTAPSLPPRRRTAPASRGPVPVPQSLALLLAAHPNIPKSPARAQSARITNRTSKRTNPSTQSKKKRKKKRSVMIAPPVAVAGVRLHRVRKAIHKLEDYKSSPAAINPFSHESEWTKREYFKAIIGVVLVPLRFVLVCLLLSMMVVVSMISSSSLRTPFDQTKPMSEERRWWQAPLLPICRAVLFVCGIYRLKVTGELCDSDDARVLVVAPHTTALDAFVQFIAGNAPSVVSKAEVAKLPFFGPVGKAVQTVYVQRESGSAKAKAFEAIKERALAKGWRHLLIFPEGTTTNHKALIKFKKGAFAPGAPVQPILFRSPFNHFDPAWTAGGPNRGMQVIRLLMQWQVQFEIEFLPIYHPSEEEKKDAGLYANNVRAVMAEVLALPSSEHSFTDQQLAKTCRRAGLVPSACLTFEYDLMHEATGITVEFIQQMLVRYGKVASMDKQSNMIDVVGLSEMIGVPLSLPVVDLFSVLDINATGRLTFGALLAGLWTIHDQLEEYEAGSVVADRFMEVATGGIVLTKQNIRDALRKWFAKVEEKQVKQLYKELADLSVSRTAIGKTAITEFCSSRPDLLYVMLAAQTSAMAVVDQPEVQDESNTTIGNVVGKTKQHKSRPLTLRTLSAKEAKSLALRRAMVSL